jgi:hypothetical protein
MKNIFNIALIATLAVTASVAAHEAPAPAQEAFQIHAQDQTATPTNTQDQEVDEDDEESAMWGKKHTIITSITNTTTKTTSTTSTIITSTANTARRTGAALSMSLSPLPSSASPSQQCCRPSSQPPVSSVEIQLLLLMKLLLSWRHGTLRPPLLLGKDTWSVRSTNLGAKISTHPSTLSHIKPY